LTAELLKAGDEILKNQVIDFDKLLLEILCILSSCLKIFFAWNP
jgi:hypothetical protein